MLQETRHTGGTEVDYEYPSIHILDIYWKRWGWEITFFESKLTTLGYFKGESD